MTIPSSPATTPFGPVAKLLWLDRVAAERLTAAELAIAALLANRVNSSTGRYFHSFAQFADELPYSERTLKTAISSLLARGIILQHRRGNGRGIATEYQIVLDFPAQERVKQTAPFSEEERVKQTAPFSEKGAVSRQKGCSFTSERVKQTAPHLVVNDSESIKPPIPPRGGVEERPGQKEQLPTAQAHGEQPEIIDPQAGLDQAGEEIVACMNRVFPTRYVYSGAVRRLIDRRLAKYGKEKILVALGFVQTQAKAHPDWTLPSLSKALSPTRIEEALAHAQPALPPPPAEWRRSAPARPRTEEETAKGLKNMRDIAYFLRNFSLPEKAAPA